MLSKPVEHLALRHKRLPNLEVLRLYREVYKFAGKFQWNNEKGEPWFLILRKTARREFDLSKSETDPFLVMKMMVTTRECMQQMEHKICDAQIALVKTVDETKNEERFTRRGIL
ncbi:unnamed protein product [Sphagnum balticum]